MTFYDKIQQMERIDRLVRLKATGKPKELARRLEISESSLYETLNTMKELGAPIYFDPVRQSYCYRSQGHFSMGFRDVTRQEAKNIFGGNVAHSGIFGVSSYNFMPAIQNMAIKNVL